MTSMKQDRQFDELCNKVKFCTRCIRMERSARVLSRAAGSLGAAIMFIGEAPGRLGADSFEIPFHGDQAGHNFEALLAFAGLDRSAIFVTNAVLCNPKSDSGNNATPNKVEISNCSSYLREQLTLVAPRIVVTLGAVALDALNTVERHDLTLAAAVRTMHPWFGAKLIPLYHPGARALIHRSMANQRSDYHYVAEQLARLDRKRPAHSGRTTKTVAEVAREIIRQKGSVSYFALHKLFYLLECEACKRVGHQLTRAFFLRQKDGPYCTDLHLLKLRRALPDLLVSTEQGVLRLCLTQRDLFSPSAVTVGAETQELVRAVVQSTLTLSDAELKTRVYLTSPMRRMLRIEKTHLINLYNSPISFTQAGNVKVVHRTDSQDSA